jgi:hypothetical protein
MLARFVADERQCFKGGLSDQALGSFGPFDEPLNLNFREASACASTCASDGFGCFAKACLAAITFG